MPKPPAPKIDAWSFSRWNTYRQCPLKAKLTYVDKLPTPPSPAMDRGNVIHKESEDYINGKLKKLPVSLETFDEEFKDLRNLYKKGDVYVELQLNFDSEWNIIEDKWSPDIWCRVKVDIVVLEDDGVIRVTDVKTGKVKSDGYMEQLDLYALAIFLGFDDVTTIITDLWFVDHGVIKPDENDIISYSHNQIPELKSAWNKRVKKMLADRRFMPTPNQFCDWCPFNKTKGGQCKY